MSSLLCALGVKSQAYKRILKFSLIDWQLVRKQDCTAGVPNFFLNKLKIRLYAHDFTPSVDLTLYTVAEFGRHFILFKHFYFLFYSSALTVKSNAIFKFFQNFSSKSG